MTHDSQPLTLTLPSDLRMLSVARSFVEAVCQISDVDRSTMHAVILAAGEAVTNIIRHAHRNRPHAHLQIQCRLRPDAIEISFLDEGDPFDLTAVPHLDPGELRVGGRGVYLMRALMDELSSSPRPNRGNTLRMIKRRQQSAPVRDVG